jgi:hypothetical protein
VSIRESRFEKCGNLASGDLPERGMAIVCSAFRGTSGVPEQFGSSWSACVIPSTP